MLMNREAWMLGCQVMNQSVEKGSMPLGGDLPWISLYSRSSFSRDSLVSDSSTCRRAPSLMSSVAKAISRASPMTDLAMLLPLCGTVASVWSYRALGVLSGDGDRSVGIGHEQRSV